MHWISLSFFLFKSIFLHDSFISKIEKKKKTLHSWISFEIKKNCQKKNSTRIRLKIFPRILFLSKRFFISNKKKKGKNRFHFRLLNVPLLIRKFFSLKGGLFLDPVKSRWKNFEERLEWKFIMRIKMRQVLISRWAMLDQVFPNLPSFSPSFE